MIKTTLVGLGDSLTIGYGDLKGTNYISRLDKYLPKHYPSIYWSIHNVGKAGATSRECVSMLSKKVLPLSPNIVFIMIGTNDASLEPYYHRSIEEYERNLTAILKDLLTYNNRTGLNQCIPVPILITPPCVIESKCAPTITNNRLHQYAYIVKSLAQSYHCPLIDFYEITYISKDKELLYQEDGIHLSKEGYDLLYDQVFQTLTNLLNYEGLLKDQE